MYDELIKQLRYLAKVYSICENENMQEYKLAVKAADAIEELVKENESLAADLADSNERRKKNRKPQWIPVTERLPEENGSYLAFDGKVLELFYDKDWDDAAWTDPVENYMTYQPTHWMPLPEPPKDGE